MFPSAGAAWLSAAHVRNAAVFSCGSFFSTSAMVQFNPLWELPSIHPSIHLYINLNILISRDKFHTIYHKTDPIQKPSAIMSVVLSVIVVFKVFTSQATWRGPPGSEAPSSLAVCYGEKVVDKCPTTG